jgi:hypothetical protein
VGAHQAETLSLPLDQRVVEVEAIRLLAQEHVGTEQQEPAGDHGQKTRERRRVGSERDVEQERLRRDCESWDRPGERIGRRAASLAELEQLPVLLEIGQAGLVRGLVVHRIEL